MQESTPHKTEEFEKYGHLHAWSEELGISYHTLKERFKGVGGTLGRDAKNNIRIFYPESLVRQKCAELLSKNVRVSQQGETVIDGKTFVALHVYAKEIGIDYGRLKQAAVVAELQIEHYGWYGKTKPVALYEKSKVDQLEPILLARSKLSKNGELMLNGICYVYPKQFARENRLNGQRIHEEIRAFGLQPKARGVAGSNRPIQLYEKRDIETLPFVVSSRLRLDDSEEIVVAGKKCTSIKHFANKHGLGKVYLGKAIVEANLSPVIIAKLGNSRVRMYDLRSLHEIPYVKKMAQQVDENGEIVIGGVLCVALRKYARFHQLCDVSLTKAVESAKISAFAFASSGAQKMAVFRKRDIEALKFVEDRMQLNRIDNRSGGVVLQGIHCVALHLYAALNNVHHKSLKNAVLRLKKKIEGYALNGSGHKVAVYRKEVIDEIIITLASVGSKNEKPGIEHCVDDPQFRKQQSRVPIK